MIRTLAQAQRWIDEVGVALLFTKADVVLPSLWDQVSGTPGAKYSIRDADGNFVSWAPGMDFLWGAKDDLPGQGLACVGKHLARVTTCVAPRLLPTLVAANGEPDDDDPVVEAIRDLGPLTGPQLRDATGLAKKEVDKAIAVLHRRLVLTSSHRVEGEASWGSLAHDLLARKWKLPKRLPAREGARRDLAATVLGNAGELTAADLRGIVGWRPTECAAVLDEIAESRDEDGFRIWMQP